MSVVATRPDLGDPVAWRFPTFDATVVGPGLVVHHLDLPGRELVSVDLLVDAPTTADPAGREGTALITARTLDEGSSRRDGDAFAAALDSQGASLGASAGLSGLRLTMDVPRDNLAAAFELLAEAITDPVFPAHEVERVVRQRLDSIRQAFARPEERANLALRDALIDPSHRSHLPGGGTADSVGTVDRDATAAFHADHVLTGPIRLVVAGDLTGVDLGTVAGTQLARWVDIDRPTTPPAELVLRPGPRVVVVDRPGSVQTQLVLARPGPDRHAVDWAAARVASFVLGGTLTSRLDAVLREEKGYTYGIRSRLTTYLRGGIARLAVGSVDTENTVESVEIALGIMRALADGGATADERDAAVDYLAGVRPLTLETPPALVSEVARNLDDGLPSDHTDAELARLRSVTTDEVSAAATAHLAPDGMTLVAVGDASVIADGIGALGHADVEVVTDA